MRAGSAVFDASVVIRAAVAGSREAAAALASVDIALAPDVMYAESANALMTYFRAGALAADECACLLRDIARLPFAVTDDRTLAPAALAVAIDRGLSAYDALYVALAEAEEVPLVTADRRLAGAYEHAELVA